MCVRAAILIFAIVWSSPHNCSILSEDASSGCGAPTPVSAEREVMNHKDAHFELMLDIQKRLACVGILPSVLDSAVLYVSVSTIDGKIDWGGLGYSSFPGRSRHGGDGQGVAPSFSTSRTSTIHKHSSQRGSNDVPSPNASCLGSAVQSIHHRTENSALFRRPNLTLFTSPKQPQPFIYMLLHASCRLYSFSSLQSHTFSYLYAFNHSRTPNLKERTEQERI
jgi:hypothetical protein